MTKHFFIRAAIFKQPGALLCLFFLGTSPALGKEKLSPIAPAQADAQVKMPGKTGIPAWLDLSPKSGLVDVKKMIPSLQLDLRYASENNFTGTKLYHDLNACVLQKEAAEKLRKAYQLLQQRAPGLHFIAYDCLRPRRVQRQMWQVVKGTAQQSYVANPNKPSGSMHNYGCAIDLGLADAQGQPLDMGTAFDFFGHKAQPRHEMRLYRSHQLSSAQLANRLLLREIMLRVGFVAISNEWWHFNSDWPKQVRRQYKIVE